MTRPPLPPQARRLLKLLFGLEPLPQSVWLFGSRANGRATPRSDTDLLVFASSAFVESLRRATSQPQDVDILVMVDSDTIIYPWRKETASFKSWQWRFQGDHVASYVGVKWIPDTYVDENDLERPQSGGESEKQSEEQLELGQFVHLHDRAFRLSLADA